MEPAARPLRTTGRRSSRRVKDGHPDFVFIAEAYWDMEWTLQQQGFDYCYDKRLYDRLAHESAESVRGHLQAGADYQERLIRFIENHDEPRAAATFGAGQARAAAVVISTLQGARLYHDGQLDGHRTRIPVFLDRGPAEPADEDLRAFYGRLLAAVAESGLRDGDWRMCDVSGWPDNDSCRHLVAWCWPRELVVVNLGDAPAQARVHLPWDDLAGRTWELVDRLSGARFERGGDELASEGLYVGLEPWAFTSCGLPQPISKRRSSKWTRHVPALNNATCSASRTSRRICWSRNCSRPAP